MPKFEDLINRRERIIAEAEAEALKRLQSIEADSWGYVADLISGLDTVEGKIVFKAANVRRVQNGIERFKFWIQLKLLDFGSWIANRFLSLFGLNVSYFKTIKKESSVYDQARKLIMLRWGWDVEKNTIIPGGFLANAFNVQGVAETVGQRMMAGLAGGMDLKSFVKTFKSFFLTNRTGTGVVVKQFERAAFDSFQTFDRTVQNHIGGELGLGYALFAGTEIKTSRTWCKKRKGRIFSRKMIESWNNDTWEGKIPGTDVKETLGGYGCRDHLSWMSDEMVELLKKRGTTVDVLG